MFIDLNKKTCWCEYVGFLHTCQALEFFCQVRCECGAFLQSRYDTPSYVKECFFLNSDSWAKGFYKWSKDWSQRIHTGLAADLFGRAAACRFACKYQWSRDGPPKTPSKVNTKAHFLVFIVRAVAIDDRNVLSSPRGSWMPPGCLLGAAWVPKK